MINFFNYKIHFLNFCHCWIFLKFIHQKIVQTEKNAFILDQACINNLIMLHVKEFSVHQHLQMATFNKYDIYRTHHMSKLPVYLGRPVE